MRKHGPGIAICALCVLWFGGNLLFLDRFPLVHSDEPWLSGLTRAMLENQSLGVTESFFDMKPRFPHAIKSLFHILQMPFMLLFGYQVFSFRLLSLLGGAGCLMLFYTLALRTSGNRLAALLATALLGTDIQFTYAAHFARQEILILLAMLACFFLLADGDGHHPQGGKQPGMRRILAAAVVTGLCIGVHPNAFLVATLCGSQLCFIRPFPRALAVYTGIVGIFALAFVGASLALDPDFFAHYAAYGSEFQVDASPGDKIRETWPYLQRLYHRVSGTYYTPDIRAQLLLFGAAPVLCLGGAFRLGSAAARPLAACCGIWVGMALVGRFSQPAILFFFPFGYLLVATLARQWGPKAGTALLALCLVFLGGYAAVQIREVVTQPFSYTRYLANIAAAVPPGAKAIGNLNAGYYFAEGALRDYRNLPYLVKTGTSLADYTARNGIEYIIVSDELSLLYDLRPAWNGIYGSINFLPELEEYLRGCTREHSFTDNRYGIRVTRFQNNGHGSGRDIHIRIYHCPR